MEDFQFPTIPKDLLEELSKRFPEKCPDPTWSEREIWMAVGRREVVRLLQTLYDEQNDNILANTVL